MLRRIILVVNFSSVKFETGCSFTCQNKLILIVT